MWAQYFIALGVLYACLPTGSQADDSTPTPGTNTYSVTLENLKNGAQSKITVSGPSNSDQLQTKALAERLAMDAVNNAQGANGAWLQNLYLPDDYNKIRPVYLDPHASGYNTSMPSQLRLNDNLIAENARLRDLIKLQEDRINLLENQLNALQEKTK